MRRRVENKPLLRLITLLVIAGLVCSEAVIGAGQIEGKMAAGSRLEKIIHEWSVISLVLAIYDMYVFEDGKILFGGIETERVKEILLQRLGTGKRLEGYRKYIEGDQRCVFRER